MPTITTTGANARILKALQSGETLTKAQIARRFRVKNVSAQISRIRFAGYPVYNNTTRRGNRTVNAYRLGTPTRQTIAAGYRALA